MFQIKQKDELSKLKGKDMEKGRKTNYVVTIQIKILCGKKVIYKYL